MAISVPDRGSRRLPGDGANTAGQMNLKCQWWPQRLTPYGAHNQSLPRLRVVTA